MAVGRTVGKNGQIYYSGTGFHPLSKKARKAYLKNVDSETLSNQDSLSRVEKISLTQRKKFRDKKGRFLDDTQQRAIKAIIKAKKLPVKDNSDFQELMGDEDVKKFFEDEQPEFHYQKVRPFEYHQILMNLQKQGINTIALEQTVEEELGSENFVYMKIKIDYVNESVDLVYGMAYVDGETVTYEE